MSFHDPLLISSRSTLEPWENPGFSTTTTLALAKEGQKPRESSHEHPKLGQLSATAICGNDITSSCLYTVGLCVAAAGVYAPICLLLVVMMLYAFRSVYGEVGTALPLNGGAYNVLLNTTSKSTASVAACLTILSYVATGVVSGAEACSYLQNVWSGLDVYAATLVLLCLFAGLNLIGITESAVVASAIFVTHLTVLFILMGASLVYVCQHGVTMISDNFQSPHQPALSSALFYGFSAAALGISGFETSSNFIEEQADGVFPKTLRNMWFGTLIFNPILSLLANSILSMDDMLANSAVVLSRMGLVAGGRWLEVLVSVDAFLVLSGAVLTSFVGVTGLVKRLTGDRCLPNVLLATNRLRGTNHYIILSFLAICVSMFMLLDGRVDQLSDVYSLAFLSVMALFAVGDMLLKFKRNAIPREVRANWSTTFIALVLVCTALAATIIYKPRQLNVFLIYFSCTAFIFALTFYRIQLLKIALYTARRLFSGSHRFRNCCDRLITSTIRSIHQRSVVFFAKTDSLAILNKALLYIRQNEHTQWVRVVHCVDSAHGGQVPEKLAYHVELMNNAYPKVRVDLVVVQGRFGREAIDLVQSEYQVPYNMMFITCPSERFAHKIGSLGGIRVITAHEPSEPRVRRSSVEGSSHMRRRTISSLQASGLSPINSAVPPGVYSPPLRTVSAYSPSVYTPASPSHRTVSSPDVEAKTSALMAGTSLAPGFVAHAVQSINSSSHTINMP